MSRDIFIGDLQGCCEPLARLLERLNFDSSRDRLLLAGDLVNRGGQSLAALRLVYSLRESLSCVLGNHDLHLLAYAFGHRRKPNAEFEAILAARDGQAMLDWLRACPLLWLDDSRQLGLVHAGVDPRWGLESARAAAGEIEQALQDDPADFFAHMYGDEPDRWQPDLLRRERLRTITNVFTRMRFCRADGALDLATKGGPDNAPNGFAPWYEHLHPDWEGWRLVFGHWSQLGLFDNERVTCLDSGCVWGGQLTALVFEDGERRFEVVDCSGCGSA
jgi:bis(5'-nucleosyl)-tetraphosphatase (symmetrical)